MKCAICGTSRRFLGWYPSALTELGVTGTHAHRSCIVKAQRLKGIQ